MAIDATKSDPREGERLAEPLGPVVYIPPDIAWEQEFVALAGFSTAPGDCENNPNPGCW